MIRLKYLGVILFSIFIISTHGKSEVSTEPHNVKIETKCLNKSIEIQLLQNEPFSGSIYIKGYEKEDTCKKNYKDVKNPILSVLRKRCTPNINDTVDVVVVIKPYSGSKIVHNIKCDYSIRKVEVKTDLRIHSLNTTPNPIEDTTPNSIEDTPLNPIEDIKQNLHQTVVQLWKKINDVVCDCNLKSYVDKIKSFVRPSECLQNN